MTEQKLQRMVVLEQAEFLEWLMLARAVCVAHEADKKRDQPELVEVKLLRKVEEIEASINAAPVERV